MLRTSASPPTPPPPQLLAIFQGQLSKDLGTRRTAPTCCCRRPSPPSAARTCSHLVASSARPNGLVSTLGWSGRTAVPRHTCPGNARPNAEEDEGHLEDEAEQHCHPDLRVGVLLRYPRLETHLHRPPLQAASTLQMRYASLHVCS
jgi:hypothetical protein